MDITPVSDYWPHILNSGETVYAGLIYRIPPRLWRSLVQVQKELKSIDPRQIYTNCLNFHIPVKGLGYLGEKIDQLKYEKTLSKIQKIISDFRPFEISLKGVASFPTGLYAKVQDEGKFQSINTRIGEELKGEVEVSRYDSESFVPHVTLATFNSKDVSKLLERANSEEMQNYDFGPAGVYELEVIRVNLILALGPEETQEGALSYMRSFWLGSFKR